MDESTTTTKTLRLILGDQLNLEHSWLRAPEPGVTYAMMEVMTETGYVLHHIQKVVAFFAAMRQTAQTLRERGFDVRYITLDAPDNAQSFAANIGALVEAEGFERFEYQEPDEHRVDVALSELAASLPCETACVSSEHFLTERDTLARFFRGKKSYLMESFYRMMRRTHEVLLTREGKPCGGRWNYDTENRSAYDGAVAVPARAFPEYDVTELVAMLEAMHVETFGHLREPERFPWPRTPADAEARLERFVEIFLPHFGRYQDAMVEDQPELFHSHIAFAMNVKLLHPMRVIRAVEEAWRADPERVPLAAAEGFIRQVLGWREYVRGVYWAEMPSYAELNHLGYEAELPTWYWTGETRMNCLRQAITESLENAYAHHIQRLMVTGNFALLAGVHPDHVDAWYLGVYADALEWVEMPNTRGMSQYADGGIVGSKPYVSSANYIKKMSNYCAGCHYNPRKKVGEGSCPFNSLFWDFYDRHRDQLEGHPRISMMYRTFDRMNAKKREELLAQAARYKASLDTL